MSGSQDIVIAGGVQNMSQVPMASTWHTDSVRDPFSGSKGWQARYGDQEISQFRGAELIAEHWDISRQDMESFALESHRRAAAAVNAGVFDSQIVPVAGVSRDEGPRPDTSLEKMASLRTLVDGGRLTAALASQISDGASAVIIVSEKALREHKLVPRARIHHMTVLGSDPVYMLAGPIPATKRALERAELHLDDIDLFEINEAFASVVLAWAKETGADLAKTNVTGGAIALGHPLGATGTRIMTSLLHELESSGGRYGLQTMCEGGGMANVTIIERLS